MADKSTSTTGLQKASADVILEVADGTVIQDKDKPAEAGLGNCQLPFFQTPSTDANKKILSLRKLQKEVVEHEINYYKECHSLELKYEKLYQEIFHKRREIITGLECRVDIEDMTKEKNAVFNNGIDKFWVTVFLNSNTLSKEIYPGDEDILKHLKDVKRCYHPRDSMNFILEFHFEANEYFTNSVLTKEYEVRETPDENDPFNYDGPDIVKCKGCNIEWKQGKNPTIRKLRRNKQKGVVKTVKRKSFFNFFNPSVESEGGIDDDDLNDMLSYDFQLGEYIKDRIIPRAVAYFTKEIDSESEESEEEESTSDSSDEEKRKSHQSRPRRRN